MRDLEGLGHLLICAFLFNFCSFMVIPGILDVMVSALCPGRDDCPSALYLSGLQQAVTGTGALFVTPLVGNLSDKYGRKALLTLPMTVAIPPLVILACGRTRSFLYAFFGIKIVTSFFCESSMQSLLLAYAADVVSENQRGSAFGIISGVSALGFVSGTLASRFLSISTTFQISATVAILALVYMRIFLVETKRFSTFIDDPSQPLSTPSSDSNSSPKLTPFRKVPSPTNIFPLLRSSMTLSRAVIVIFFQSLGESGFDATLMFYLKAKFHFNKNQFADILLMNGIASASSQLFLMPILALRIGEETLLIISFSASCIFVFLYSIAWASWVPYLASIFVILGAFVLPCIRSIASKKVGSDEQGLVQGSITGLISFSGIIAPLAFNPLTALFLSETAPFNFKGFSIMCMDLAMLIGFALNVIMRAAAPV